MRFAVCDTTCRVVSGGDDARPSNSYSCVACGASVGILAGCGEWEHLDKGKSQCPLRGEASPDTIASAMHDASAPVLIIYCPDAFGGQVALYLMDGLTEGFAPVTWCRNDCWFSLPGGSVVLRPVIRFPSADRPLCARDVLTVTDPLTPLNDEARRVLHRFHSLALQHVDPTQSALPRWRAVEAPPGGGKTTLLLSIAAAWPHVRFTVVTFARDIAQEVRRRFARHTNVRVCTLDSVCYALEGGGQVAGALRDQDLIETFYPRCKPWFKKKNSTGLSQVLEDALARISGPGDEVELCETHKEYTWIGERLLSKEAREMDSGGAFSCMRARCLLHRTNAEIRSAAGDPDVLLVDEAQDLTAQALEILRRVDAPTLLVGDRRQRIFRFGDRPACETCLEQMGTPSWEETLAGANSSHLISLYATHRLGSLSCSALRDWTGGRLSMVSARPPGKDQVIVCSDIPPSPQPILVLARTNQELVEIVQGDDTLGVVGGAALAAAIVHVAERMHAGGLKKRKRVRQRDEALERLVNQLVLGEKVKAVVTRLRDADCGFDRLTSENGRVVSTVHRAKGVEAPTVAVHDTTMFPTLRRHRNSACHDQCVAVVAGTRHTEQLVIIRRPPPPVDSKR